MTSLHRRAAVRHHTFAFAALTLASLVFCQEARAADEGTWWLRLGPGQISFSEKVTLRAAGNVVPGAGATVSNNTALLAELGYRITPEWAAGLTIGIPPTTKVTGSGTAQAFGKFGEVTYAPMGLTAQYRLDAGGWRPYAGAGVVYYMAMRSKDAAIQQLDVDNAWGSVLQIGAEVPLSKQYGFFIDVKKLFLKTHASGVLPAAGGAPVTADITLNPLVVHAGISVQF